MEIQYVSDLHLDSSLMRSIERVGDVLVVAGDVSYDERLVFDFFERRVPSDMPVVFVPGNHEYECKDVATYSFKELLCPFPHVHVLEDDAALIEGVCFVGTPLWSDFEGKGAHLRPDALEWARTLNDFKTIGYQGKRWTPELMALRSQQAQEKVISLLKASEAEKKVLVTHFAPHIGSVHRRYFKNGQPGIDSTYWCNNLPELLAECDLCIHGHVHDSFDYQVGSTQIVCNPRGYSRLYDQAENVFFDPRKTVAL